MGIVAVDPALIGYAATALMFAALAVLLAARGSASPAGRLFIAAVAGQALWAALIALAALGLPVAKALSGPGESIRLLAWLVFLLALLKGDEEQSTGPAASQEGHPVARFAWVATSGIVAAGLATDLMTVADRVVFALRVIGAVLALVSLEQVYRNTPTNNHWALKFLAVGCTALFGFDLLIYSEALMFSRLNQPLWTARGIANALLVPIFAIAAIRNPHWNLAIAVSRAVVFHTATLSAAGLFLLTMAAGGYWVRYIGGQWADVMQALVAFVALIGLMILVGSGRLRARLRVLLAKHFFRYRYDYRAEWLKLTALLTAPPEGNRKSPPAGATLEVRALQGLAGLVESTGAALWLLEEHDQYHCVARWRFNAATPVVAARDPLAEFLSRRHWIVDLSEWRSNQARYAGLVLPGAITQDPQNWLIIPLLLPDQLIGFAVLREPITRVEVDWEVRDALRTAAHQVASFLALRRAVEALVQARQFESFNRMSAFVVHDLKNLVAQLSLLMANAARHRENPAFQQDLLDTVDNVLDRMQGLLRQLRAGTRPAERPTAVTVADALATAIRTNRREPAPNPELLVAPGLQHARVMAHPERLERVIGHLVQNAAEATSHDGRIRVRLTRDGDRARIDVEDTGRGMSEQFIRDELFRPFHTTKPQGMGIGTFESRDYIRELGGSLEVTSRPGVGTVFSMRLPLLGCPAIT